MDFRSQLYLDVVCHQTIHIPLQIWILSVKFTLALETMTKKMKKKKKKFN